MSEEEPKPSMPSQAGSLIFEGRKATQFWLRALDLEEEVKAVQETLAVKPERKRAVVPIAAEYRVDEEFIFIYLIQLYADTLGVQDGLGVICWASPEREAEVRARRDAYTKTVLEKLGSRPFDEVVEIELKEEK